MCGPGASSHRSLNTQWNPFPGNLRGSEALPALGRQPKEPRLQTDGLT